MKKFSSIKEAVEYQTHCPVCDTKLQASLLFVSKIICNDNNISFGMRINAISRIKRFFYNIFANLFLYAPDSTSINIKINILTGKIKYSKLLYLFNSTNYENGINVECPNCVSGDICHYYYQFDFEMDLQEKIIHNIRLYKESIIFKNKNVLFERMTNYYLTNQTLYLTKLIECVDKCTSLPLIQFNKQNLKESFSKAKRLIIFT